MRNIYYSGSTVPDSGPFCLPYEPDVHVFLYVQYHIVECICIDSGRLELCASSRLYRRSEQEILVHIHLSCCIFVVFIFLSGVRLVFVWRKPVFKYRYVLRDFPSAFDLFYYNCDTQTCIRCFH